MPAVMAGWIAARHLEQRGSRCNDDSADVRDLRRRHTRSSLLELEFECLERRHFSMQTRRFVLASPSFRKAVRGVSIATVHQRDNIPFEGFLRK